MSNNIDKVLEENGFKISHHYFRTPIARLKVAITQVNMAIEIAEDENIIPPVELHQLYQIDNRLRSHLPRDFQ